MNSLTAFIHNHGQVIPTLSQSSKISTGLLLLSLISILTWLGIDHLYVGLNYSFIAISIQLHRGLYNNGAVDVLPVFFTLYVGVGALLSYLISFLY